MFIKQYSIIKNKLIPYIVGGKGCFAAGTLVSTPFGSVAIEDILPGDQVFSYDMFGNKTIDIVKVTHTHNKEPLIKLTFDSGHLICTKGHWVFFELNRYKAACNFIIGDLIISEDGSNKTILSIENIPADITYNLTIQHNHNFIANGIKVHNKGGGKGGGSESENSLFSTDILFLTVGVSEGPIYRINPNGPQDIEINEDNIDDLINLESDGSVNTDIFYFDYNVGTLTQHPLIGFGNYTTIPQVPASQVILKKGNISGVPRAAVVLQNTSSGIAFDVLRFMCVISGLYKQDSGGNTLHHELVVRGTVYDHTGQFVLGTTDRLIVGKTMTTYKFFFEVKIPEHLKSTNGYKFTIEKISDENELALFQDNVSFAGWEELVYDKKSYPRTAHIGYAIKATSEYESGTPQFSSMVKGIICRVPSNYNQPTLENGDIDWRYIEQPSENWTTYGYYQQKTGTAVQTGAPVIYEGLWDGTFTYAWTQNPVWIVYDILTDKLGIPEEHIDKYKFYKVGQYCDAVDPLTGIFSGVSGVADGTYIYKPRTLYTNVKETLLGLPKGTLLQERRFICDIIISSQKQVVDVINQVTALFRGILFYSAGKITLNADMPDEYPMMIFNETNIEKDSLTISGSKETEIVTGVEVSYLEPSNHYRREMIRIDDPKALQELNHIENVKQIDLAGCTRRSMATRMAQYLIADSKYPRRKVTFKTSIEAVHLTVGNIIAVSQRQPGTAWGFGGRVASNSAVAGNTAIYLEHFTHPGLSETLFVNNTKPLGLRVIKQNSDKIDFYILSKNNYTITNTGNVNSGSDWVRVVPTHIFNLGNKSFSSITTYPANLAPQRGDLWTFGEIDPNNFYNSTTDKLFKVTGLDRDENEVVIINAREYISNVFTDSDSLINYTPTVYENMFSPLIAPPTPNLTLVKHPIRNSDGSVRYDLDIIAQTDVTGYPLTYKTEIEVAYPEDVSDIEGIY